MSEVTGGKSQLVAAHLHLALDGDGITGSGPAVALFCGDNTPGLLSKGIPYPEECSPYDWSGVARMPNMAGVFAPAADSPQTVADLVKDMEASPGKYYFNFHSLASFSYWQARGDSPKGVCRGVVKSKIEPAKPTKCYDLFSSMQFNSLLQDFPNNPDSRAAGFVSCSFCTNGTMSCLSTTYGGKSPIIAAHLHIALNGNGEAGSGPAVGLFCGDNTPGLLSKGTPYPAPCNAYSSKGYALQKDMKGVIDPVANGDMSIEQRIEDLAANPGKYYFNLHSLASFSYWQASGGTPAGMCRGVMKLS